ACTVPYQMLAEVALATPPRSDRKWRLLACALCRRIDRRLRRGPWRRALESMERWADDPPGGDELSLLRAGVSKLHHLPSGRGRRTASFYATDTVYMLVMHDPLEATESIMTTVAMVMENDGRRAAEEEHHCALFRDIFGNPFRPLPSLDRLQSARNGRIITD